MVGAAAVCGQTLVDVSAIVPIIIQLKPSPTTTVECSDGVYAVVLTATILHHAFVDVILATCSSEALWARADPIFLVFSFKTGSTVVTRVGGTVGSLAAVDSGHVDPSGTAVDHRVSSRPVHLLVRVEVDCFGFPNRAALEFSSTSNFPTAHILGVRLDTRLLQRDNLDFFMGTHILLSDSQLLQLHIDYGRTSNKRE